MSQYRDGIKLKTTTPSVALLKLLRKWYPNQSLSELRTMIQNHDYIYLTDQEKSWIDGDRKMAKFLKELERAGFETELYRERRNDRDPQRLGDRAFEPGGFLQRSPNGSGDQASGVDRYRARD